VKKLPFLLVCALVPVFVGAAPASATEGVQWQVVLNFHSPGYVDICRADYDNQSWTTLDADGDAVLASVPADAANVAVGTSTAFVNRGNTSVFAKAFFQKLKVYDPTGKLVIDCDASECQGYWSAPYRYNDWTNPFGPLVAYNPTIGGGMMWAVDWFVQLPPDPLTGKLAAGTYRVEYWNMVTHRLADPMFPGRVPGKVGYPPIGGPWGWEETPMEYFFTVH
jgi:hypothetical protein